ncbi:polysaccharide deacetylase (plasmid) [Gloeothece citriformis PCC 7424]|uniref:Polysaccharide deacetylase n=1 Tax=Gloeothece citriformis (strain PCC 7424) TaxID=65393 RepID=B7KMW8_GLOC7|nr:chitin deacetylase family protein [Gloeothece citriformis]ACK74140.1 polysaccharide deacetylase [Gloeothece citriformis PCC 7424]
MELLELTLYLSGLGIGILLFFQPRWLLSIALLTTPGVVYFVETNEPVVALTLDDGPDSTTTPKILNLLLDYKVHATFFLISTRIFGNETIVTEIVRQGHELGNHLTDDKPSIRMSTLEFEAKLLEAQKILGKFAETHWLRPSSGFYNTKMLDIAYKYGYRIALGSIFPYDTHIPSSWFASKHILSNVSPGSIIILHDGGYRGERTVSTLKTILPKLSQRGYQVVTLSKLLTFQPKKSD